MAHVSKSLLFSFEIFIFLFNYFFFKKFSSIAMSVWFWLIDSGKNSERCSIIGVAIILILLLISCVVNYSKSVCIWINKEMRTWPERHKLCDDFFRVKTLMCLHDLERDRKILHPAALYDLPMKRYLFCCNEHDVRYYWIYIPGQTWSSSTLHPCGRRTQQFRFIVAGQW